ncbi:MAG: copper oxidase [Gammaproteobacteria bacterium]|uniref:multicopper oxidase family protein n=1 Tax=Limnobacter sp. TaxID=2003368 RepID=UPI001DEEF03E|nr:copper oxidase [Limnobacter sp.]MBU0784100.1 copper oxidase [Gammaproteobacteria bacterium]MBU0849838.1 copper oxidase [Gammaproteobacteria bacterium]MBU1266876.1 copper oxidase [Gammaproteobacteria bacterium]MBU1528708.1 copper oxidase [Gammaproteobacteria bacterium]MBU1779716.1 copper oxidase [Gammaproteobacteria bacterium]
MTSRREFFKAAAMTGGAVAAASVSKVAMAALPEPIMQTSPDTMPPLVPSTGRPYNPVVTLNGWTLPWRMNKGVKEFHLVAEPVLREMAPGMTAHLWGYNGQSPGPTIEVVEGDRVRIFVTNKLPEHTSIHWHGQRLPNGMDGVAGLNQPAIPSGKTFVYEFEAKRPGTFMYHPHADEMVQMAMGMMGFWVTHPKNKNPLISEVDRDYCFLLNAYDIDPGAYTPKIMTMLDFNLWTWNSRLFPGISPLVARQNDRVRLRVGNLTMTNHPIHIHGHEFEVTGTDGGPTPKGSRWPEVTVDIAVGQMRQMEFIANEEGDWAFHCHKSHHTMNAMGHDVPTMIGVDHRGMTKKITNLIPDYMVMGERGMADMAEMQMPLPDNTIPMMTGDGPFGSVEMGGMFSMLKVRKDQKPGDYSDPGWYKHPEGTVAYEFTGELAKPKRSGSAGKGSMELKQKNQPEIELKVRKPSGHSGH